MKRLFKFLLVFTLSSCSQQFTPYANWANDIVGDTDENFTNGVEIGVSVPRENLNETAIAVMETLPTIRLQDDPKFLTRVNVGVRQDMYTPSNLREPGIIKGENPYGGATSVFFKRFNELPRAVVSSELELGVSGSWSGAEETQRFIHTDLGFGTDPKGWDNQIAAEPFVNMNFRRQTEQHMFNIWGLQFYDYNATSLRLGTKATDLTISRPLKFGYFGDEDLGDEYSVYIFSEPFAKGTLHNMFYDGTVFKDSIHTVDSTPATVGIDNGLAIKKGAYSLKLHYNLRTRDYKSQGSGFHRYGIISMGYDW